MKRKPCGRCGQAQAVRPGGLCNRCFGESTKTVETIKLRLDAITVDPEIQARVGLNDHVVEDYTEAFKEGAKFPPLVVFDDWTQKTLAAGFHRYAMYVAAGVQEADCIVKEGGPRDAKLYAIGDNSDHGLRRTTQDKERAIKMLLADAEWKGRSTEWLAKTARVSWSLVDRVRKLGQPPAREVAGQDGRRHAATREDDEPREPARPKPLPAREVERPKAANLTDAIGQPLPDNVRDAFGDPVLKDAVESVRQLFDGLPQAEKRIQDLLKRVKSYPFLLSATLVQRFDAAAADLQAVMEMLQSAIPHAVCPDCFGNCCATCRDSGYLPEWAYQEATKKAA